MRYEIYLSEVERNHIIETLRKRADDTSKGMDGQVFEAFTRGSIDNTPSDFEKKILQERSERHGTAPRQQTKKPSLVSTKRNRVVIPKKECDQ